MGFHVLNVDSHAEYDMPRAARGPRERKRDVIGDSIRVGACVCVLSLTTENGMRALIDKQLTM